MLRAAPWLTAAIVLTTALPSAGARSKARSGQPPRLTLGAAIASHIDGALTTMEQVDSQWQSTTTRLAQRWHRWVTGLTRFEFRAGAVAPWLRETGNSIDRALDVLDPRAVLPRIGLQTYRVLLAHPVDGKITSEYGMRRDPIHGRKRFHKGIDLRGDPGTPVHAAAAGVVTLARPWQGYGNCIVIDHGLGVETRYGHLSAFRVAEGDFVAANAFIGAVGETGRATGPHLHFELRENGVPIDPMRAFSNLPPPPAEPANARELLDSWRKRHDIRRILKPQS